MYSSDDDTCCDSDSEEQAQQSIWQRRKELEARQLADKRPQTVDRMIAHADADERWRKQEAQLAQEALQRMVDEAARDHCCTG